MAQRSFCRVELDYLDVMVLPEELCWSVGNDAAGWAELVERLRGFPVAASGVEASGGYERGVIRALLAAGLSVRHVNPFKLRQFAKACGVLAKNDRIDARMSALVQGAYRLGYVATSTFPPSLPCVGGQHLPHFGL